MTSPFLQSRNHDNRMPFAADRRRWSHQGVRKVAAGFVLVLIFHLAMPNGAVASNHYTEKQLDALATRVGKTYWLSAPDGRSPAFLSSPAASAATFRPAADDSFVITDLAGRKNKNPYYAVRFESGKVGYIRPDQFHEALNVTILSSDPRAGEKERAEKQESEEKARVEWINSQPWSPAVKESAIRRQPPSGLKTSEVKRIMGAPLRVTKLRTPVKGLAEEHWFYAGGTVLIFHNGLLTKTDHVEAK